MKLQLIREAIISKTGRETKTPKKRLRRQADKLWFDIIMKAEGCEVCGKIGQQAHHFFPKGQFGHLRYNLENGICLCGACHFAHHHKADPRIHQTIIEKRGKKWYNKLLNQSRNSPASYQTKGYYSAVIDKLNELSKV